MAFEHFVQSGTKQLRCGYTTGTCAALAAQGASMLLLSGTAPSTVCLRTPKGWTVEVEPETCETLPDGTVRCAVRKDAGDDPDVTDGMPVVATVSFGEPSPEAVVIDGGDGVGRVTKPGLDQPVGNAAINRVPRQMIRDAVLDVCEELDYDPAAKGALQVIISIPGGEEMAKKTFNPKLGVEGGLSVLGTSGVVEPMSEQALKDTIAVELRQAFALQKQEGVHRPAVLLTPGNYGKDFLDAQGWSDLGVPVVKISNYVGDALDAAVSIGFEDIQARETMLCKRMLDGIKDIPHVMVLGSDKPEEHHGIITFKIDGVHPHDISAIFADNNVAVRAGHHCAQPLHICLGIPSTTRASVMFYNTEEEVDRFLDILSQIRGAMGYGD